MIIYITPSWRSYSSIQTQPDSLAILLKKWIEFSHCTPTAYKDVIRHRVKVSQHSILSTWWSGVSARNRREIHVLWKDPRACDQTRTAWDLTRAHYIMQRSLEFGVHVHAVLCLSDGEWAVGFWWGVGPCDKWSGWGHAGASGAQLLFGIIYRCENCLLDSLEVFSTDGTCLKAGNLHMSVWHQLNKNAVHKWLRWNILNLHICFSLDCLET